MYQMFLYIKQNFHEIHMGKSQFIFMQSPQRSKDCMYFDWSRKQLVVSKALAVTKIYVMSMWDKTCDISLKKIISLKEYGTRQNAH